MSSCKTLLFGFILAKLTFNFVSSSISAEKVKPVTQKDINDFKMIINDRFKYVSDKVDQLELNVSKGNNAVEVREIIANFTQFIINSNKEIFKKVEKFEANIKKIENFGVILFQLLNKSEDIRSRMIANEGEGGQINDLTSYCRSTCQDKVATWANQTGAKFKSNLQHVDFWDSIQPKAFNICQPCANGGKCRLTSTGNQHECLECPKFRSGKHCENLQCSRENRCWKRGVTLYAVHETRLNWTQAKEWCEGWGMILVMPKDKETNEFLIDQLGPIFHRFGLWMGLTNDELGCWRWVDGSALGQYTGGWADMKSQRGPSVGVMYARRESQNWSHTLVTDRYYPVCEQNLNP